MGRSSGLRRANWKCDPGKGETKIPDEMFYDRKPKLYDNMVPFGLIGHIKKRERIQGKLQDKTYKGIMIGYAKNHAADTYRLYNPDTKRIILSRDVRWEEWKRINPKKDIDIFNDPEPSGIDEDDYWEIEVGRKDTPTPATVKSETTQMIPTTNTVKTEIKEEIKKEVDEADISKLTNALKKLSVSYNPEAQQLLEELEQKNEKANREVYFVFNTELLSDPGEPTDIMEAITGPESKLWIEAAKKEVNNFITRGNWKECQRTEAAEQGRKIIPVKWVFKKKNEIDGSTRFKCRIVVKGYLQIPGVDFTESISPVATDTTIRLLLGMVLYNETWKCHMFDVEAAFLNAEMENPMYLEWPEGMVELGFINEEDRRKSCIKLVKSMYGNVDAALRWMNAFTKVLIKNAGLSQSQADPCLFYKHDEKHNLILMVVVYVDDVLIAGTPTEVIKLKNNVKNVYNITDLGELKKHCGIWYDWSTDEKGNKMVVANMQEFVDGIIMDYEKKFGNIDIATTPGLTNSVLRNNNGEIININDYRSFLGRLMYYVTKIGPDCANAVRELSQYMSNPGTEHWKQMTRVIGYLKGKEKHTLVFRKPERLQLLSYVDSNFATNPDMRRSVTGMICTIGGMITFWMSKGQNLVTLSSTEAEYVALATCAQETRFQQMLLDEITQHQVKPAIIYEDNTGAIYLVKNKQVGGRTKHIDTRHHFIRQLVDWKLIKVMFVRSEHNYADMLTKNLAEGIFQFHVTDILQGTMKCWREDDRKYGEKS